MVLLSTTSHSNYTVHVSACMHGIALDHLYSNYTVHVSACMHGIALDHLYSNYTVHVSACMHGIALDHLYSNYTVHVSACMHGIALDHLSFKLYSTCKCNHAWYCSRPPLFSSHSNSANACPLILPVITLMCGLLEVTPPNMACRSSTDTLGSRFFK